MQYRTNAECQIWSRQKTSQEAAAMQRRSLGSSTVVRFRGRREERRTEKGSGELDRGGRGGGHAGREGGKRGAENVREETNLSKRWCALSYRAGDHIFRPVSGTSRLWCHNSDSFFCSMLLGYGPGQSALHSAKLASNCMYMFGCKLSKQIKNVQDEFRSRSTN